MTFFWILFLIHHEKHHIVRWVFFTKIKSLRNTSPVAATEKCWSNSEVLQVLQKKMMWLLIANNPTCNRSNSNKFVLKVKVIQRLCGSVFFFTLLSLPLPPCWLLKILFNFWLDQTVNYLEIVFCYISERMLVCMEMQYLRPLSI